MEFKCSICEYTSSQKIHVVRHFNKVKSCGPGIKEIIEIPTEIKCKYCNKNYSTQKNLKEHQKNNCKNRDIVMLKEINDLKEKVKQFKKQLINANKIKIRTDARKIYKQKYKHLACIHCKNKDVNNIQICHIKALKDFSLTDSIEIINDLSNLISLCANCHLDFDKTKKFEVSRTVLMHSFIVKHLQSYEDFKLL